MALTRITSELITDGTISTDDLSSTAVTSISGSSASSSFSSRITLVEDGTTTKTLISSSAQIASDISGSFTAGTGLDLSSGELSVDVSDFMANGSNNRIITATGTDAQNAEANLTFDGSTLNVTGDATITGTLTAQEIHTEFESASIIFTSGSTIFGNSTDDTHLFSGSVAIHNGEVGVAAGSSADELVIKNNGDAGISVLSPDGNSSRIQFGSVSDNDIGHIGGYYNSGNEYLFFSVDGSARMVIGGATNAGNVGIGTTNPDAKLKVEEDTHGANVQIKMRAQNDSGAGRTFSITADPDARTMTFGEVGGFHIQSDGSTDKVGIGTSSPAANLEVISATDYSQIHLTDTDSNNTVQRLGIQGQHYGSSEAPIRIIGMYNSDTTSNVQIGGGSGDHNSATLVQFFTSANTTTSAGTLRMIVSSSGYVGIGTDNPSSLLHVYQAGSTVANSRTLVVGYSVESSAGINGEQYMATILNTNNNAASNGLAIGVKNDNAHALIIGKHDATFNSFVVNGDGKVGVGTTSPDFRFHIYNASDSEVFWGQDAGGIFQSVGTNQHMRFLYDNGNAEVLRFLDGGGILTHSKTRATLTAGKTYASGANVITFTVTVNNVSSWEPINFLVEANYTTANLGAQGYFYGWGHTYHYSASGLAGTSTGQGGASSNITVAVGNYSSNSFDITVTSATTSGTINMIANLDIRARHGITNITAA